LFFLLKKHTSVFTANLKKPSSGLVLGAVTLMIPDSKPYIKFFIELDKIISNLEKPLESLDLQQNVLKEFIP